MIYLIRGVGVLGLLLYILLLAAWSIEWEQSMIGSKSMVDQAWFIISYGILTSGLAPLMLSTYFFLICSKSRDHLWGLVIVLFAIVIHYIVTAFVAHNIFLHLCK